MNMGQNDPKLWISCQNCSESPDNSTFWVKNSHLRNFVHHAWLSWDLERFQYEWFRGTRVCYWLIRHTFLAMIMTHHNGLCMGKSFRFSWKSWSVMTCIITFQKGIHNHFKNCIQVFSVFYYLFFAWFTSWTFFNNKNKC